jgi:hypothetical protein
MNGRHVGSFAVAAIVGVGRLLVAQSVAELHEVSGARTNVVVEGFDGTSLRVRVGDAIEATPIARVARLAWARAAAPAPDAATGAVWLRSGTRLTGRFESGGGTSITFAANGAAAPIVIPLRHVQAIRFGVPRSDDLDFTRVAGAPEQSDVLFALRDEAVTRIGVTVKQVRERELVVDFAGAERTLPVDRAHGIVFGATSGVAADVARGVRVVAAFAGGDVVVARLNAIDAATVTFALDEGPTLTLPRERLARLDFPSDRLARLGEWTPELVQIPALDRVWPVLVDRAVGGGPIRIGGETHAHGVVVRPQCRATYALPRAFDWFECTLGIEDGAGRHGDAEVAFALDGDEVRRLRVRAGQPPTAIRLDVRGKKTLTLIVDFGAGLDLGDHVAFGSARLWRGDDAAGR